MPTNRGPCNNVARCLENQARHAEKRIAAQFQRIAKSVIHAAENHIDRMQTLKRFEENAAVAHREIAAFDQSETQIARKVSMLEIGFVVRPWGEQNNVGIVRSIRRQTPQGITLNPKE